MQALYRDGWSKRRIAAELRISRNTLDHYLNTYSDQSGPETTHRSKLTRCLEWLEQQDLSAKDSYGTLQQKMKAECQIHVSQRTIMRAIQQLRHRTVDQPETSTTTSDNTVWGAPMTSTPKGNSACSDCQLR